MEDNNKEPWYHNPFKFLIVSSIATIAMRGTISYIKTQNAMKLEEKKRIDKERLLYIQSEIKKAEYQMKQELKAKAKARAIDKVCEETQKEAVSLKSEATIEELFSEEENARLVNYNICGPIKAGHTVLIYGGTGCGKSIVANQIAISMQEENDCTLFPDGQRNCKKQAVFVFDAELSDDDIEQRGLCKRVPRAKGYAGKSADAFFGHVSCIIDRMSNDTVIVVDNVTVGIPDFTQWQSTSVLAKIKSLKDKANDKGFFLTFILIAHSDNAKSFSLNNMKGFKTLQDISNLIFEIESAGFDSDRKCIKIMKNRNGALDSLAYLLRFSTDSYWHFIYENKITEDEAFSSDIPKDSLEDKDDELMILLKKYKSTNKERDLQLLMIIREYAQKEDMTEDDKDKAVASHFSSEDNGNESISVSSVRRWKTRMKESGIIGDGRSKKSNK